MKYLKSATFFLAFCYGKKEITLDLGYKTKDPPIQIADVPQIALYGIDGVDVTSDLDDFYDSQIFATMYLGTSNEPFDFIFDSGSPWTWVWSRVCSNCPVSEPKYNEQLSEDWINRSKKPY